ncbi:MAG: hypothetical protein LCH26_05340 [Proteobacteria bacterium]|nr:hypothetical protein [Pseudomonadota bacterium]
MHKSFLPLLFMGSLCLPKAQAFELSTKDETGQNVPIEIDAKSGITCEQKGRVCTAKGDVVVTQGDTKLTCDTLKAYFHMDASGKPQGLERLEAIGSVHMTNTVKTQEARSNHADFLVDTSHLTMTGGDLFLTMGDTHVSARDSLEYYDQTGHAEARGDVRVVKGEKLLEAQEVDAYFTKDKEDKRKLERLEARHDVFVSTPEDMAEGDAGVYTDADEVVVLNGRVKLTKKGQGQMVGERGRFDMKQGVSFLLPATGVDKSAPLATMGAAQNQGSTGRVKVLLLPQKKKDESGA